MNLTDTLAATIRALHLPPTPYPQAPPQTGNGGSGTAPVGPVGQAVGAAPSGRQQVAVKALSSAAEAVRKAFTDAGGHHDSTYWGCWMIGDAEFEKFAEKVSGGVGEGVSSEILPETLFYALKATEGRYDSMQDRAVAILMKLRG